MFVDRLGLKNSIKFSAAQNLQVKQDNSSSASTPAASVLCSPQVANAIMAQKLASVPAYKFLEDVKIPSLNLDGKLYLLPNGQKCLVAKKDGPTVIKTFFRVGSMNEPDYLRGISHFIEHNLFNGSKNLLPTEFVSTVNKRGGNYNASTGFTTTDYYIQSPLHNKDDLEKFIQIHSDMLINPTFSEEMIEKERGPVISEIQMLGDNPYNVATNTTLRNLFGIKSTSKELIGGAVENIKNMTRKDVIDYYKSNYTPNNALTVVIGDIDEKETMKLLSKYFSDFKREKTTGRYEKLSPTTEPIRRDIYLSNVRGTIIQLGFQGAANEENKTAVNALITALTGYKNARISDALRDITKQTEGQSESISNQAGMPTAILFSAVTSKNNEEEILKIMYQKLHEMTYIPLTPKELDIVKRKLKMSLNYGAESNISIASILGGNFIAKNNFEAIKNSEKNIEALTAQDIMNAAKKYLDLNKVAITVVHPKNNSNNISFSGKTKNEIKTYITKNNAQITTQHIPNGKLYSMKFEFTPQNFPSKSGIPAILSLMLEKGSSMVSEKDFSSKEDENNIKSSVTTSYNTISYNYSFPKDGFKDALEGIYKRIAFPPLTKENFEQAKKELKNIYLSSPKNPFHRGIEALYENSVLCSSIRKTVQELDNITFEDVAVYYNDAMKAPELKVIISGDMNNTDILSPVYWLLSTSEKQYVPINKKELNIKPLNETIIISEAQEQNQANIIQLFRINETGNVKDTAAILLLNEILGGNSNSRLFNDLREKQKLAYKVRSAYMENNNNESYLTLEIGTTTDGTDNKKQADNLKKAIDGFKFHTQKLINKKVSKDELEAAKLQIKSKLAFAKESTEGKNQILSASLNSLYGSNYEEVLLNAITNTTAEDIQKIAAHYLAKPSVISVVASEKTLKANEEYLKKIGCYKQY